MSPGDTRQKMVDTAVTMFQRQGYRATSWRSLVQASETPWGSVQHHFPGGKEELGVAAVTRAGDLVGAALTDTFERAADPADGVRSWFAASASLLAATDYASGCPVAPVVLETAHDSTALADAGAGALARWVGVIADALRQRGVDDARANQLATAVIAGFEGALVLARAQRSTGAMIEVGELLATCVDAELPDARPAEPS